MVRAACIMMQKDEGELLRAWVEYHGNLFGYFNLYIFDNSSSDLQTLQILEFYQKSGISVNRAHVSLDSHLKKDKIFAELIKKLDVFGSFDFIIPLDCDEFFLF